MKLRLIVAMLLAGCVYNAGPGTAMVNINRHLDVSIPAPATAASANR
jgi:hypothetical protein